MKDAGGDGTNRFDRGWQPQSMGGGLLPTEQQSFGAPHSSGINAEAERLRMMQQIQMKVQEEANPMNATMEAK
jgi:hypothetical protein